MIEIQLLESPDSAPSRKVVEDEPPRLVVEGARGKRAFVRTGQHTPDGLRIYAAEGTTWATNTTLGWVGMEGIEVESDYDPNLTLWRVVMSGHGHSVRTTLTAFAVATGMHLHALDRVAARLSRAGHHLRTAGAR